MTAPDVNIYGEVICPCCDLPAYSCGKARPGDEETAQ